MLDPFVGGGTTLVSARDLGRNAVGFDLKPEYVGLARQRLAQSPLMAEIRQIAICDDAGAVPNYLDKETVSSSGIGAIW